MNNTIFGSAYRFWFSLFGGIASGISAVSVTQRLFNFGLTPILFEVIAYYRKLIYPLFAWLPAFLPAWYKDAFIISIVFALLATRAALIHELSRRSPREGHEITPHSINQHLVGNAIYILMQGIVLSILVLGPFYCAFMLWYARNEIRYDAYWKNEHIKKLKDESKRAFHSAHIARLDHQIQIQRKLIEGMILSLAAMTLVIITFYVLNAGI